MGKYDQVLADLRKRHADLTQQFEAKIRPIEDAIIGIEEIARGDAAVEDLIQGVIRERETRPFQSMTIRMAAKAVLEREKRPMKTKDLAEAILAGGFDSSADNFTTTVYGTLARIHAEFRVSDGWWRLADWTNGRPSSEAQP